MKENYKPLKSMKEVPDQLRKLRREYIRYGQAELIYSMSHKKILELAEAMGHHRISVNNYYSSDL